MAHTIGIRNLSKFVEKKLGYKAKENVSLYVLVCDALKVDGICKPEEISYRKFVENNGLYILESIGKKETKKYVTEEIKRKQKKESKKEKLKLIKNNSFNFDKYKSKEFLMTYEWRKLRMEAIKKYGNSCQCCGASPKTGAILNVDHIKPRKHFPHLALDIDNLQILCSDCNHGKGNWDQTDWRA